MKFEVSERIQTTISASSLQEIIVRQFRKISNDVNNQGNVVASKGIEASFGSINRTDNTFIKILSKEPGYLVVADVDYHPSVWFWVFEICLIFTWVGWVIPLFFYINQKKVVRKAIEDVLKRVKDEAQETVIPIVSTLQMPQNNSNVNNSTQDLDSQLRKLAKLKEDKIITEEEFDNKKKKLLGL